MPISTLFVLPVLLAQTPSPLPVPPKAGHVLALRISQEDVGSLNHPLSLEALRTELALRLMRDGFRIREAASDPMAESELILKIQSLKAPNGVYLYGVTGWMGGPEGKLGAPATLVAALRSVERFPSELAVAVYGVADSLLEKRWPKPPAAPRPPTQIKDPLKPVDFDFSQVKIRRQPAPPPYPPYAKQNGIQGVVVVDITINPEGLPQTAKVVTGPAALQFTALSYALDWAFEPALLNGHPQWARFRLTMPFKLRDGLRLSDSLQLADPTFGSRGSSHGPVPR